MISSFTPNAIMQPTIVQDALGQTTIQRSIFPVDMLTAPALAAAPSQSSGTTFDSFYTAQSLQTPYLETPPSSPGNVGFGDLTGDVPIIAVMGLTGAGKSTFIKIATGSDEVQVGDSLNSCTQASKVVNCRHPFRHVDVSLVDTPGFDDTFRTDAEILRGIADWLEETYQRGIKLSGILYLHRITDNRVPHSLLRNLELLRRLCGDDILPNIRFVTTNWDLLAEKSEGERKEEELRNEYWSHFIEGGSQMYRFQNTHPSAWEIINSLPMEGKATLIQQEMVDHHIPLPETSAGKPLFAWASKALREIIARLESLIRTFISSATSHDKSQNEANRRRLREARDELRRIESLQSLPSGHDPAGSGLRSRSNSIRSLNRSSESVHSTDSDITYSSLRSRFRQRLDGRRSPPQRHGRDSQVIPRITDPGTACFNSVYLGPTVLRTSVCDIPDTDSLLEVAIGADSAASGTLTGTIQTLKFARAAVTGVPVPGLAAAVGSALHVAELLDRMRDMDQSLVVLINNIGRFIKTICSQDRPIKAYPQPVIEAIEQFIVQLRRIENVARRIGKKKWLRRCLLEPEDRRIIIDCNDAIKLALHSLGIRIGLATAAQNEDILLRLNEIQGLVTRMLNVAELTNYEQRRRRTF